MHKFSLLLLLLLPAPAIYGFQQDHAAHHQMMSAPKRYTRASAPYRLPEVTLVDQNGDRVRLQTLLNGSEPVALNFVFTTCTTICPVMTATFSKMRSALGSEAAALRMLSVSIDPEYDTPGALREYAGKFHAGPNWTFLTGTLEDVIAVQKAFDAFTGDKNNHRPLTFLRGRGAPEWVRIDGLANGSELAAEVRELLHGGDAAAAHHHH